MLKGFEPLIVASGIPRVTISRNGVSFNKATVEKMGKAPYVCVLIDRPGRRFAISPDEGEDSISRMDFFRPGAEISNGVRWNSSDLKQTFHDLMGWDVEHQTMRADGFFDAESRAIIFDLNEAVDISKGREGA